MRVIDFFDRGVSLAPDRACLVDDEGSRSYRQVREASLRISDALYASGAAAGTKVAVYSPNAACAFECVLGLLRAGCVWVAINARNALPETCDILGNSDVEVLFYHDSFASHLAGIREACPSIRLFICIGGRGEQGAVHLEDWVGRRKGTSPPVPDEPSALCSIFSSGGTTGRPKGVMHSNRVWEAVMSNFHSALPSKRPPVHLVVAPMTHGAGGHALCLMALGATQVIMRQFDASKVLEAIERHRVTHLFLPPTAIYMLLAHPKVRQTDFASLEYFLYGAAPMSVDKLIEAMEVFGPVMTQAYGQVEIPLVATIFSPREHAEALEAHRERLYSCGRSTLLTRIEIMDDAGNLLPPDQPGEIVARGSLVMLGYYKNPEATREVSVDGWHHTGDIGRKDADGYIYLVDRKRDMIISGGFNVYPSEIEQVIWSHPAVQDCAVVGVPDEKWGEAVKAIVELRPGATATDREIIALCREKLGGVKAPKSVEFWAALPRSAVGKVLKREIRAQFWKRRDRAI